MSKDVEYSKGKAVLAYDVDGERLTGEIGKKYKADIRAFSGGSRGHQTVAPKVGAAYLHGQAASFSSRFANTAEKKDKKGRYIQRGGPLPPGLYSCEYVSHHASFGACIRLHPQDHEVLAFYGRSDSFFIHGRGAKGSDGCIVPQLPAQRHALNIAVRDFKGQVFLRVINVGYVLPAKHYANPALLV